MTTRRFPEVIVTNQLPNHVRELRKSIRKCSRWIPNPHLYLTGKSLEPIFAASIGGHATGDNSFVDVVQGNTGWQLKSNMNRDNFLVLRRAKVDDKFIKIVSSKDSATARQDLGNELLKLNNENIEAGMEKHNVDRMGLCHINFLTDNQVEVTEAFFAETRAPFNPDSFYWEWSNDFYGQEPNKGLPSLLGIRRGTDKPWFSWSGQNENHFNILAKKEWLADRCDTINRYGFTTIPRRDYMTLDLFEDSQEVQHKELVIGG